MRVGVFFPGFDPTSGGGYSFEYEILQALLELFEESSHEFVIYLGTNSNDAKRPFPFTQKIQTHWITPSKSIGPVRMLLSQTAGKLGWKNFIIIPDAPLQKAVERDNIQFMWFATSIFLPVEIPYIATVFDIQHRLQPWFPEVSRNGQWKFREEQYSSYLRRATYVITPNKTGQNELSFFYQIPQNRFHLLPHPVPRIEHFPLKEQIISALQKYGLYKKFIFYPAQFWAHKNHINLLCALKILNEKYNLDFDLVLTGSDQGNLSYVQSVAENLKIRDQVHFLGFVSREELVILYMSAFVLTYVTFFGPENLPPLEAFSCGCPVIASDIPGAEEQYGEAALRINPNSPEEIALAIKKIHDDVQLRAELVTRGYARSKSFTSSDYVKKVFTIIDDFQSIRINWE